MSIAPSVVSDLDALNSTLLLRHEEALDNEELASTTLRLTRHKTEPSTVLRYSSAKLADSEAATRHSVRLYVDVSEWRLSGDAEYQFLLELIGDEQERAGVEKYRLPEDRQRALVSRLLARKVSAEMCGLAHNDVSIQRTRSGKPFLSTPHTTASQPNFNFNISHDGDFVVLASEPTCLVGVDVVAPREKTPNRGGRDALRNSFTYQEQAYINGHETEFEKDRAFGLLWSCKEAYIKARGDGLKFELTRANFFVVDEVEWGGDHVTVLRVEVDNVCLNRWTFHSSRLASGYVVTVAKGPPCDAVDPDGDFTHGFTRGIDAFTPLEWTHELDRVQADFVKVPVGFLVPEPLRAQYEALGAEAPNLLPEEVFDSTRSTRSRRSSRVPGSHGLSSPGGGCLMGSAGYSPVSRNMSLDWREAYLENS